MLPLKVTTPASLSPLSSPPSLPAKNQPTFWMAPFPKGGGAARFGVGFLADRYFVFLLMVPHRRFFTALPFAFANSATEAFASSATSGIVTEFPICL